MREIYSYPRQTNCRRLQSKSQGWGSHGQGEEVMPPLTLHFWRTPAAPCSHYARQDELYFLFYHPRRILGKYIVVSACHAMVSPRVFDRVVDLVVAPGPSPGTKGRLLSSYIWSSHWFGCLTRPVTWNKRAAAYLKDLPAEKRRR